MLKEANELIRSVSHESDRGCILVVAALIENVLKDYIKARLVGANKKDDELFDGGNAPLGNLSAKIDMAFRLGLIQSKEKKQLHLMRKIRNDCAHNPENQFFDSQSIQYRMQEIVNLSDDGWDDFSQVLAWRQGTSSALSKDKNEFINVVGWRVVFEFKFLTLYAYLLEQTNLTHCIKRRYT
jgi:hypothetical protein